MIGLLKIYMGVIYLINNFNIFYFSYVGAIQQVGLYDQGGLKERGGWQPPPTEEFDWSREIFLNENTRSNFLCSCATVQFLGGHRFVVVQLLFEQEKMFINNRNVYVIGKKQY